MGTYIIVYEIFILFLLKSDRQKNLFGIRRTSSKNCADGLTILQRNSIIAMKSASYEILSNSMREEGPLQCSEGIGNIISSTSEKLLPFDI